jgi:cytochrome P450
MQSWMLFRDPPDHTRLRGLVNKAFTPKAVEHLEAGVVEIVQRRLDELEPRGCMEFLTDFAYPVPALVICQLIGAPLADHSLISRHAPAIATRLDPSPMRNAEVELAADRAVTELTAYIEDLIATKRRSPGDDLTSRLLAAHDGEDRLDHEEVVSTLILLFMAGHETTANLMTNGLYALLTSPVQWRRYRDNPSLDRSAVEELMRYEGPIHMAERIALADTEVNGHSSPAGRIVILCTAAANRDPLVFERPEELRLDRDPNPHVGFGGGIHFCVGAPLARMEARIGLRQIADRLKELRVVEPTPRWRPSFTIRGLTELHLSWSGRRDSRNS